MTFLTSAVTAVTHNHWSESVLLENTSDDTPELQDNLKCLADSLHDNLVAALALERLFGEQNDKTMYIAPFIRSVIHTAVTGVEIQHVSSYPVAIDPCFVGNPLLRLLSHYGHATDIICANIPAPVTYEEDGDGITSEGSSSDDALNEANDYDMQSVHEEHDNTESERTTRRWLAGEYMTKRAEDQGASTDFYHNQDSSTSSDHPPAAPDYSLLARLTVDSSTVSTPLALICVSQAKEIYAAMTSCLYQRLAWGIHEPMAGIALDDKTCNVRILFGRFQPSQDSDCSTVHISDSEKGCYDLSDDSSALEFASFLSRLCRHFPTIYETAIAFTPQLEDDIAGCRLKLWRLDQAVLVGPEEGPSWAEKITRWLDSIDASSYVDDQPPCVAASSSNIAGSDVMSAKETRPPSSVRASSDSNESMHCRTISATELAAGGKHEDKTLLMSFWMLARMVITRTLMFPSMLLDEKYKLDNSLRTIQKEYYDLLSFSWINNLTVLDRNLQTLPLVEIAQAVADRLKQDALRTVGQRLPYRTLSASCEKILCDNLWEIASVLEDVQRINGNGKTLTSELECRHNLDQLMMRFFHVHSNGSTEKLSQKEYSNTAHVMISLECSLMLPTGSLVDVYTKCDDITDQVDLMVSVNARTDAITIADSRNISKFAKALSRETSNVVPHARNTPDPTSMSGHHSDRTLRTFAEDIEAVQKSAQAALERNNIGRLGVIHVAKGKENPMLQPYNEEPLKAVCDSAGYIRIPEVFTSIPASSSFNIIQPRHASPSPSKCIPKQSMPSDSDSSTGNGTSLARRQQMGRDFEMDNPDDLFAISQSFYPSRIEQPVTLPVEQASKHSLNMSVLTGGELEDNDDTEKMAELDVRRDLFLPIISSQHKKVLGICFATNVYQGRMYATASVKFYVALGIYNIGVYTIISEGSVLVVTVSYAEKPDDEDGVPIVHILERNAISFDISEPLGILNFATFLIKLRVEYVPKVLKRVYSVIGDSPVEIRKYLKTLNIPTGGDKNQAAWRKHKP